MPLYYHFVSGYFVTLIVLLICIASLCTDLSPVILQQSSLSSRGFPLPLRKFHHFQPTPLASHYCQSAPLDEATVILTMTPQVAHPSLVLHIPRGFLLKFLYTVARDMFLKL